ncbi:hypothetical protein J6590_029260 [Homalodisca vitripennis]|nr:hypothetical protein J6590_029260 [Homalodisca vitripennis]
MPLLESETQYGIIGRSGGMPLLESETQYGNNAAGVVLWNTGAEYSVDDSS